MSSGSLRLSMMIRNFWKTAMIEQLTTHEPISRAVVAHFDLHLSFTGSCVVQILCACFSLDVPPPLMVSSYLLSVLVKLFMQCLVTLFSISLLLLIRSNVIALFSVSFSHLFSFWNLTNVDDAHKALGKRTKRKCKVSKVIWEVIIWPWAYLPNKELLKHWSDVFSDHFLKQLAFLDSVRVSAQWTILTFNCGNKRIANEFILTRFFRVVFSLQFNP